LKHAVLILQYQTLTVAPHAGAWVETCRQYQRQKDNVVAPHAGAWVETKQGGNTCEGSCCRPPRGGVG